eukprot:2490823-Ditylum_brightwellii.AAC.1
MATINTSPNINIWKQDDTRENWANSEEIGDNMQRKVKDHTRIHMLNPNGISMEDNAVDFKLICECMNENNIDNM